VLKKFYGCTEEEFRKMTLYMIFRLLENGEKIMKGKKESILSAEEKRRILEMAKQRGIKLPKRGL